MSEKQSSVHVVPDCTQYTAICSKQNGAETATNGVHQTVNLVYYYVLTGFEDFELQLPVGTTSSHCFGRTMPMLLQHDRRRQQARTEASKQAGRQASNES